MWRYVLMYMRSSAASLSVTFDGMHDASEQHQAAFYESGVLL